MDDVFSRVWEEIAARPHGPLAMRYYLQPAMATFFAIRDGIRDARTGWPPFFWSLVTDPGHRREEFRSAWKSIGKVIILAIILDLAYQVMVLKGLRPFETLFVANLLAILPYVVLRGVVNRIARGRRRAL